MLKKKKSFNDGQLAIDFTRSVQYNAEMTDIVKKLRRYVILRKHSKVMPIRTSFDSAADFKTAIENYHKSLSELEFLTKWLNKNKSKFKREYFEQIVTLHPDLKHQILGFGITPQTARSNRHLARAFNQYQ